MEWHIAGAGSSILHPTHRIVVGIDLAHALEQLQVGGRQQPQASTLEVLLMGALRGMMLPS